MPAARTEHEAEVPAADVCVIGGGPVGITLALALASASLKVTVLEGGEEEPAGPVPGGYTVIPGQPVRLGRDATRPLWLGGNTNHWFGNCRPLDQLDFVSGEGEAGWPIDRDELLPWYVRAQHASGLGEFKWYELDACLPHLEHGALRVDPAILETRIVHCCQTLSFADLHREKLLREPLLRIVPGARAVRLCTDSSGSRVTKVDVAHADGRSSRVEADVFVLAGGGVENADLLLRSDEHAPEGIGNAHDLVGRFFQEHWFFDFKIDSPDEDVFLYSAPTGRIGGAEELQKVGDARVWAQLVLSETNVRRRGVPGFAIWFQPIPRDPPSVDASRRLAKSLLRASRPEAPLSDLRIALSDSGSIARHGVRRLRGRTRPLAQDLYLRVQVEQRPRPENRIRRSPNPAAELEVELDLQLSETELESAVASLRSAADEVGLDGNLLSSRLEGKFRAGDFGFFFHHMGTTRMHPDPTRGVVDSDCRVHGVTNLYAVGCSVFPTGGTAAPTLTAVALGLRLAEHLTGSSADGGAATA